MSRYLDTRNDIELARNRRNDPEYFSRTTSQPRVPPLTIRFKNVSSTVIIQRNEKGIAGLLRRTFPFSWIRSGKRKSMIEEKIILNNVNGVFRPSRLTAILGASGSGKTTLLNILAGLAGTERTSGEISLNGHPVSGSVIRRFAGYVFQEDVMMKTMTVREVLAMSVRLHLPGLTKKEQIRTVEHFLDVLQLKKAADTRVGSATTKGISGGERKRTAIGMELVSNPPVMFLDEPTSGLDSYTALTVASILKQLAITGRTIVAVLHQPSSEVFHLFDDLMIMSEGSVIYAGSAQLAVNYFENLGFICPTYSNPADFFFTSVLHDTTSSAVPQGRSSLTVVQRKLARQSAEETDMARVRYLIRAWERSKEARALRPLIENPIVTPVTVSPKPTVSSWEQYVVLVQRSTKNSWRDTLVLRTQFLQNVLLAVFGGLVYFNTPALAETEAQIQNYIGVLFFISVNLLFTATMGVITLFGEEKSVFLREYVNGYYRLTPYYLSKISVELPLHIIFPLLFAVILYYMVGLRSEFSRFLVFAADGVLLSLSGTALGLLFAATFRVSVAILVIPIVLLPVLVFGGLFVNLDTAPAYLSWIQWISPVQYSFSSLTLNQFSGWVSPDGRTTGMVPLRNYGILSKFSIGLNLMFLAIIFFACATLAYISLWLQVRKSAPGTRKVEKRIRELMEER